MHPESVFEPTIGVAEFAQMIRDAGCPMSNGKLLGIAQSGAFRDYRIYLYQGQSGSVEGLIIRSEAERWITAHSVEPQMPDYIREYLKERGESA